MNDASESKKTHPLTYFTGFIAILFGPPLIYITSPNTQSFWLLAAFQLLGSLLLLKDKRFVPPVFLLTLGIFSVSALWLIHPSLYKGGHLSRYHDIKFDSMVWKDYDREALRAKGYNSRRKMVGDLTENVLPSASCEEVLWRLKGKHDEASCGEGRSLHTYRLGASPNILNSDFDYLIIKFDDLGVYDNYVLFTDST